MESLPCWENGAPVVAVCLTVRGPGISCPPPKLLDSQPIRRFSPALPKVARSEAWFLPQWPLRMSIWAGPVLGPRHLGLPGPHFIYPSFLR